MHSVTDCIKFAGVVFFFPADQQQQTNLFELMEP